MTSEATVRAQAFVDERLPEARALGTALAELIDYPDEFVALLRDGLERLTDPVYAVEQERVAPGSGAVFGVRSPLLTATMSQLRRPLREGSSASALWLAERLATEPEREFVFFCQLALRTCLPSDPEQSWQLMRRLARSAHDWIRVDSLAGVWAQGILAERVRWAEVEQLVYSRDLWERRLVGSTIATLPFEIARARRTELRTIPALDAVGALIGDAEEMVQKSLSWALRSWREVDAPAVDEFLRREARRARQTGDGHRAWVVRDALHYAHVPPAPTLAAELRRQLAGIRRSGGPSTSSAAEVAARFGAFDRLSETALAQQGVRQRMAGSRS